MLGSVQTFGQHTSLVLTAAKRLLQLLQLVLAERKRVALPLYVTLQSDSLQIQLGGTGFRASQFVLQVALVRLEPRTGLTTFVQPFLQLLAGSTQLHLKIIPLALNVRNLLHERADALAYHFRIDIDQHILTGQTACLMPVVMMMVPVMVTVMMMMFTTFRTTTGTTSRWTLHQLFVECTDASLGTSEACLQLLDLLCRIGQTHLQVMFLVLEPFLTPTALLVASAQFLLALMEPMLVLVRFATSSAKFLACGAQRTLKGAVQPAVHLVRLFQPLPKTHHFLADCFLFA
uniref:Uncharacterized protein n=1 Tax=Anopheles coluzzii TaxID=1518534 RepID=A0A8W7P9Z9_ANOCL